MNIRLNTRVNYKALTNFALWKEECKHDLMKTTLIEKLHALLQGDDITAIKEAVREIRNDWKAETAKEKQLQLEAYNAEPVEEGVERAPFEYVPNELEEKFQELMKSYEDRVQEHGQRLAAERQKNLDDKLALIKEFETLVANEENIGKAFGEHKALKEKWDAIGDVPGDKYHELQDKWAHLNHEFFYNINIYKTLQEHDLKINQKKKEELIEEVKSLASVESVSELEILVKKFQREWMNIGPTPRETFKELGDAFFGHIREASSKIQAHYDVLHANSEENLAKKQALVEKMKEILQMEITNSTTWNKWTEEVIKLQEEWRTIGWAKKKENEEVWQEFRGLCDLFFSKRKEQFEQRRASFKEHKDKKEELILKAKALQDSSDWKATTEALKKLQEQWKAVGSADPRDEQKLWQRFRSACDIFFQKKKEHFSEMVTQQEENLRQKIALLEEIEATELTGNKSEDLAYLKSFGERWHGVGFVPKDNIKSIMDRYNAALDAKYGQINADREQREMHAFKNRIDSIKNTSGSGDNAVKRERFALRDKLDRLFAQIKQYENNMGFFTGKGAEAMRKEIEKKIKSTEREIEDIKKKMEMLDN